MKLFDLATSVLLLFVFKFSLGLSQTDPHQQQQSQRQSIGDLSATIPNIMLLLPLQQKVEKRIHEAVDIINQIIHSTNDSMSEYFDQKYRRLSELHDKLVADVNDERTSALQSLDKMIVNSKETVLNLQKYFAEVMDLTMEKTYGDIKSILGNAVNKIDAVSRDIKDNLKLTQQSQFGLVNEGSLLEAASKTTSITDLLDTGIDSIRKLAFKFKNEPLSSTDIKLSPKWAPVFEPARANVVPAPPVPQPSALKPPSGSTVKLSQKWSPGSVTSYAPIEPSSSWQSWPVIKLAHQQHNNNNKQPSYYHYHQKASALPSREAESAEKFEQAMEVRSDMTRLEQAEKRMAALVDKIIANRAAPTASVATTVESAATTNNLATDTTNSTATAAAAAASSSTSSGSNEKIVMTKSGKPGGLFNQFMNLLNLKP